MARRDRNKRDPSKLRKRSPKGRATLPNYTPLARTDGTTSFETELIPDRLGKGRKQGDRKKRDQRTYPSSDGYSVTVSGFVPPTGRCTDSSECATGFSCVDGRCIQTISQLSQKKDPSFDTIVPQREQRPGSNNGQGNGGECGPDAPTPPDDPADMCAPIVQTVCNSGQCGENGVVIIPNPNCPDRPSQCPCPERHRCIDGICYPVVCTSDEHCPSDCEVCNENFTCENFCCNNDNDCPPGMRCFNGKCTPLDCCDPGYSCPPGMDCVARAVAGDTKCICEWRPFPPIPDKPCPPGFIVDEEGLCVPSACPCPAGYVCENGECVEKDETIPEASCSTICTNFYKANGSIGSNCRNLTCTEPCEECGYYGNPRNYRCQGINPEQVVGVPCFCDHPSADQPSGVCEECDQNTGEIVPKVPCETCCTAPAGPCPECPNNTAPSVKVCVDLEGGSLSDACAEAYSQQEAACKAKPSCCDPTIVECSSNQDCGYGWVWAQGSPVAYRQKGKCGDGWDQYKAGVCYSEVEEVPVDPFTGRPT